ncbi:Mor transcription activator family protein [Stenotrophomonas sp. MMGLT7]|uniref:Mor transcription activator family protein n=1 Tax=Stenotrophomonas sp. MMGLT7 TaxID=2901227 RepID=UPI001E62BCC1|nr:Mor transcription activator family protein [Stenotrophomonas sp. MMGLT7]MCD7099071.1 hypothetical protein [Stenotrophomonas sp. MMGLT7]
MKPMEARRHELLTEVAELISQQLVRTHAVSADLAELVGSSVADALAEHWGGQIITYPKDAHYKASKREHEILLAHRRGATFASLARETGMTERGVRRLINRAQVRASGLDQPGLFDQDS